VEAVAGDHQVAAGRTGEVTEARTEAEAALAAYVVAWREQPGTRAGVRRAWLLRLFLEALDRLAYAVMDARLWWFELLHGSEPPTPADQKREAEREGLQRALSEIDITYSS
jgi:hypothetical protein